MYKYLKNHQFSNKKYCIMNDVTLILTAIEQGDAGAADKLLPMVYKELRRLAEHKMSKEPQGHGPLEGQPFTYLEGQPFL
jgi:DNA-binding GntR family transcriptional regulator